MPVGAPLGNTNNTKGTRWRQAIESALNLKCKSDGQKALVDIATQLLDKAASGDVGALKELGDRMDGKAPQAINVGGQENNPLTVIAREIIDPQDKDS